MGSSFVGATRDWWREGHPASGSADRESGDDQQTCRCAIPIEVGGAGFTSGD
jgi:hypothetical protein